MDTAKLTFNFEKSNDKSWFVNNLGKQLMKDVTVLYNKETIYNSEMIILLKLTWTSGRVTNNEGEWPNSG